MALTACFNVRFATPSCLVAVIGLVWPLCAGKALDYQRAVNLQLEACLGVLEVCFFVFC